MLSAEDFRVKYMSEAYGAYHPGAFRNRAIVGKRFAEFVVCGEDNPAIPILRRISESGKGEEISDYLLKNRDGGEFWVDWSGSPIDNGTHKADVLVQLRDVTQRMRVEEALRQKTALFEAQTAASLDGILVIDENNKRILVNHRIVELYQVPQYIMDNEDDSLLLKHVVSLTKYPEKFLEKVTYLNDHINETSHDEIEFKKGMVLDRYSAPVFGKDGKYYGRTWTFHDITELRKAEGALKQANDELEQKVVERTRKLTESESFLRGIMDNASEAMFVKDCSGHMLMANPAFYQLMGIAPEKVLGKVAADYHHPEVAKAIERDERQVIGSGITKTIEEEILTSNGRKMLQTTKAPYRDGEGRIVGYIAITRDITERKKAEEELSKNLAVLAKSQEIAHLGSWAIDYQTGRFDASDENYRINGLAPGSETKLDDVWGLVHSEDLDRFREYVERMQQGQLGGIDYRIVWKDGSLHYLHTMADSIDRGPDGKVKKASGITQDITERKRLEEDLRRSNDELQKFAYIASHDMKEPLRMVTSYLSLLEKRNTDKLDPTSKEYMHFALDGAQRMAGMIDDLLAYSRVETKGKEFSLVNMDDVLSLVLRDLEVSIEESSASITNEALPMIMADRSQMIKLLENLFGNAIKYRGVEAPQIHISARDDGRNWVFAVKDNGIGIDPKHKDRLFQMFQRLHTRDEYEGTGIGLAIARKIVERHGGRIWFESGPGKGTIFYFAIPIVKKD